MLTLAQADDNGVYPPIVGFASVVGAPATLNCSAPLPVGGLASPAQFQCGTNAYPNPAYGLGGGIEPGLGTTVANPALCPG